MKRLMVMIALVLSLAFALINPQAARAQNQMANAITLDAALRDFSAYIVQRLPANSITAVNALETPVSRLGNYITDKLSDLLVNWAGLKIISRQDFEKVITEQNAQTALHFNDDSTAKIGHLMGWNNIIYGVVDPLQDTYHLSLRAVDVETGALLGSKTYLLIGNDPVLVNIVNPSLTVQRLHERDMILAPFDGGQNDFRLTLSTNKTVYYDQDYLYIHLRSEKDCYFVVYHLDANNYMQVIFPNRWETGTNLLKAGVERVIPENTFFLLHAPYGEERVLVYASEQPIRIPDSQYRSTAISEEYLSAPGAIWRGGDGIRALAVKPRGATSQISYTLLPGAKNNN